MIKQFLIGLTLFSGLMTTANTQAIVIKNPDKNFPPPQLGIAPPRIEQSLQLGVGKILDQSITLYNYNSKAKIIHLSLFDTNKKHQLIQPNNNTLAPWTIINPTEFTIEGNGQQTIRLSIRPPMGFTKKAHYAMLKIEQQTQENLVLDEDGKGITLGLGSSYGLPFIIHIK